MIPTGEPVDLAPPEADREEHALRMKKNLILLFLLLAGVIAGKLCITFRTAGENSKLQFYRNSDYFNHLDLQLCREAGS